MTQTPDPSDPFEKIAAARAILDLLSERYGERAFEGGAALAIALTALVGAQVAQHLVGASASCFWDSWAPPEGWAVNSGRQPRVG